MSWEKHSKDVMKEPLLLSAFQVVYRNKMHSVLYFYSRASNSRHKLLGFTLQIFALASFNSVKWRGFP